MKTITFEMSDSAAALEWCFDDEFSAQLRLAAAIFWYDRGLISQGKGAAIAGLTRAGFIRALSEANISPLQVDAEELTAEVERTLDPHR